MTWRFDDRRDRADAEVKIFGERNTGTNALKALIERNSSTKVPPSVAKEIDPAFETVKRIFAVLPGLYGARFTEAYIDRLFGGRDPRLAWKHTATRFKDLGTLGERSVVITTRHPASWLLGLHRRPYHALSEVATAFPAFLTMNWKLLQRDNLDNDTMLPGGLWSAKARSHLAFAETLARRNVAFRIVKFEDFVVDQRASFGALKPLLSDAADDPAIIRDSTKDRSKDHAYYRDYYGRERWTEEIDGESAEIIRRTVDWSVAGDLGYVRPWQ